MTLLPINWSEERKPNADIRYHHVTASTPFGDFLITWKGWKDPISPVLDKAPWPDCFCAGIDLEDMKKTIEMEYHKRIMQCVLQGK